MTKMIYGYDDKRLAESLRLEPVFTESETVEQNLQELYFELYFPNKQRIVGDNAIYTAFLQATYALGGFTFLQELKVMLHLMSPMDNTLNTVCTNLEEAGYIITANKGPTYGKVVALTRKGAALIVVPRSLRLGGTRKVRDSEIVDIGNISEARLSEKKTLSKFYAHRVYSETLYEAAREYAKQPQSFRTEYQKTHQLWFEAYNSDDLYKLEAGLKDYFGKAGLYLEFLILETKRQMFNPAFNFLRRGRLTAYDTITMYGYDSQDLLNERLLYETETVLKSLKVRKRNLSSSAEARNTETAETVLRDVQIMDDKIKQLESKAAKLNDYFTVPSFSGINENGLKEFDSVVLTLETLKKRGIYVCKVQRRKDLGFIRFGIVIDNPEEMSMITLHRDLERLEKYCLHYLRAYTYGFNIYIPKETRKALDARIQDVMAECRRTGQVSLSVSLLPEAHIIELS